MSLRSKTQKAKKFGTPSAPSPTAQKSSPTSPRATGGTPSAPSPTAQPRTSSPKTYGITQTQAVQEQFKTRLQALTAPIRDTIRTLTIRAEALDKEGGGRTPSLGAREGAVIVREQIAVEQKKIEQIEQEQHDIELQSNVNQIIQSLEGGDVLAPDYFQNNIAWVKTGAITQQAFLDSYYYLSNQGIIQSAPTEPEIIIEEKVIEEEKEPEIFGEIDIVLTDQVKQIINDIENGVVLVPDWFVNNIDWAKTGQITQQEFVTAYNYSVDQGWIHAPTEKEKEEIKEEEKITKKPSPKNGPFSGTSALGLVAVLVLVGAAVTVFKREGN